MLVKELMLHLVSQLNVLFFKADESHTFMYYVSLTSVQDRRFAALQRTLLMYVINKCISLFDIYLTVHH